jgi:hypothetical protein
LAILHFFFAHPIRSAFTPWPIRATVDQITIPIQQVAYRPTNMKMIGGRQPWVEDQVTSLSIKKARSTGIK